MQPVSGVNDFVWKMAQRKTREKTLPHACAYCTFMYRDKLGNCMCGHGILGDNHRVKRPFDEGCRKWYLRRDFQPEIGDAHKTRGKKYNEDLARYVRWLNSRALWEHKIDVFRPHGPKEALLSYAPSVKRF